MSQIKSKLALWALFKVSELNFRNDHSAQKGLCFFHELYLLFATLKNGV